MKTTRLILLAVVLLSAATTLTLFNNAANAQQAKCWFSYSDGCTPSGATPCTSCNDDGPVIKPKR